MNPNLRGLLTSNTGLGLPCYSTDHVRFFEMVRIHEYIKNLLVNYKWRALFELMPHVLWDNNEGDSK